MISSYAIDTPVGTLYATERDGKVVGIVLPGFPPPVLAGQPQTNLARELSEYFTGTRTVFSVPFAVEGPAFYQRLWQAVLAIPYGQTVSYAQLASAAGSPKAARAAGQALAANPLPILVPCHRAVYAHGNKQNYQGGAEMKEYLLGLERSNFKTTD